MLKVDVNLLETCERLKKQKNEVYKERNLCVALIADFAYRNEMNVGIKQHEGDDWEDEWRNVIFIDLPTGQVSWHIHISEMSHFSQYPEYLGEYDGHTTEEKYDRIREFVNYG